jgi:glucose-1-phosphatase
MHGIRNIILDLGGVVVNIDTDRCYRQLSNISDIALSGMYSIAQNDPVFTQFEKGLIDRNVFYKHVLSLSPNRFSQKDFEKAWNSIIVDIPKSNLDFIERLSKKYRVFALSNTNEMHIERVNNIIQKQYGKPDLNPWFEQVYLSFETGMAKPALACYTSILKNNNLKPDETLFVDDTPGHVEAAKSLGLMTSTVMPGRDIHEILKFF